MPIQHCVHAMYSNRSHFRNVRFFDEVNPDAVLGGLIQNRSLIEKNFLLMFDIILAPQIRSASTLWTLGGCLDADSRLDVRLYGQLRR